MRTKITILSLALSSLFAKAQVVADFESFTLTASSAYSPAVSTPFQTSNAIFRYEWDPSFGGFWSGGFAYTNIQDSVTGTFSNMYGVRALKGYSNSATWVVGQDSAIVKLKAPFDVVDGFYITNTTYAYKSIVKGDAFARKFGDTTGTGSGTTIPQGAYPDFFKVIVRGFKNGIMKTDSAVFYLADYRFANNNQDYVVNDWRWVNTTAIGSVDSLQFSMKSSDVSFGFMNTPAFFAIDNFSATAPNPVGVGENKLNFNFRAFPNPFHNSITVTGLNANAENSLVLRDVTGKEIYRRELQDETNEVSFGDLAPGIYFMEISSGHQTSIKKLVKE